MAPTPALQPGALGTRQASRLRAEGLRPHPVWEAPLLPPLVFLPLPTELPAWRPLPEGRAWTAHGPEAGLGEGEGGPGGDTP